MAGRLLRDQRMAKKVVVEGQVSSSTDPAGSPMKETSMARRSDVRVCDDDRQSVPTRPHSVRTAIYSTTLVALTIIEK